MTDTDAPGSLGGQQPVVDPLDNNYLHGAPASLIGWLRKTFYLLYQRADRQANFRGQQDGSEPGWLGRSMTATAKLETHGQAPAGYKAGLLLLRELKAASQKYTAPTKVKKDSVTETIRIEERNLANFLAHTSGLHTVADADTQDITTQLFTLTNQLEAADGCMLCSSQQLAACRGPGGKPRRMGSQGVGMGLAWGWPGVSTGLAWGWHGVGMGLAWG
jgi:hypothetical protein